MQGLQKYQGTLLSFLYAKFGVSPWGPIKPHIQRCTGRASCSQDHRDARTFTQSVTATQENVDLFTFTLAWSHRLTVLPDPYTEQPHSFRLTRIWDKITNTHTPACSHKSCTHRQSHTLTLLHTPSHTHTIRTVTGTASHNLHNQILHNQNCIWVMHTQLHQSHTITHIQNPHRHNDTQKQVHGPWTSFLVPQRGYPCRV